MRISKQFLIGLMSVTFVCGSVGLVQPSPSQAVVSFGGVKNILKSIFPPCGPGTKNERFVVKGETVCDNTSGLWWQRTPGYPADTNCGNDDSCLWEEARAYCTNLDLKVNYKKKQWRLPEIKELISLVDYSVVPPGPVLPPDNPFIDVQPVFYWSATEGAGFPEGALGLLFSDGFLSGLRKDAFDEFSRAWCVSDP